MYREFNVALWAGVIEKFITSLAKSRTPYQNIHKSIYK